MGRDRGSSADPPESQPRGAASASVVPAAALPAWPRPTNPTAPGSRSATAPQAGRIHDRAEGRSDNPGPPAYTLPAGPSTNSAPAAPTHSGGVGSQPAGPPQNGPPVATSMEYHQWARNQRPKGTTYGGQGGVGIGQMTMTLGGGSSLETSGSLTGHILSQGHADAPSHKTHTAKVIVVGLILLGLLVVGGLIAATAAGDALTDIFNGFLNG